MLEPTDEDTASLLSLLLFSFADSMVFAASRTTHLALDQLPALSDKHWMKHLMMDSSKVCHTE